jgi:hypothetical protein
MELNQFGRLMATREAQVDSSNVTRERQRRACVAQGPLRPSASLFRPFRRPDQLFMQLPAHSHTQLGRRGDNGGGGDAGRPFRLASSVAIRRTQSLTGHLR